MDSPPVRSYAAVVGRPQSNPSSPTATQQRQQPVRPTPSPPPAPSPAGPTTAVSACASHDTDDWEKVESTNVTVSVTQAGVDVHHGGSGEGHPQQSYHVTIAPDVEVHEKSVNGDEEEDEDSWLASRILRHESTMDLPLSRDSSVDVDVYIDKAHRAAEAWNHGGKAGPKEQTKEEKLRAYSPRNWNRFPDTVPRAAPPPGYQEYEEEQNSNPTTSNSGHTQERHFHDTLTEPNVVKMPYGLTWKDQSVIKTAKEAKPVRTHGSDSEDEVSTSEEEKAEILGRYGSLDEHSRKRLIARDLKARQEEKSKEKTRARDRHRRHKRQLAKKAERDADLKKKMIESRGSSCDPLSVFDEFRCSFLEQNLTKLQDHWKGHPLGEIELVPLCTNPVKKFLEMMDAHPTFIPTLCFHGTAIQNLGAIFEKGLCVPGEEGVRVAHGSAYGVGIYVGTGPGISSGYTNKPYMLICCTLRPPGASAATENQGVTDHGGLMVIFKSGLVVPLFVANYSNDGIPAKDFITNWRPLEANPNKAADPTQVYFEALRSEMKWNTRKRATRHFNRMTKKKVEKELKREREEKDNQFDNVQGDERVMAPWGAAAGEGGAEESEGTEESEEYESSEGEGKE